MSFVDCLLMPTVMKTSVLQTDLDSFLHGLISTYNINNNVMPKLRLVNSDSDASDDDDVANESFENECILVDRFNNGTNNVQLSLYKFPSCYQLKFYTQDQNGRDCIVWSKSHETLEQTLRNANSCNLWPWYSAFFQNYDNKQIIN